MLARVKKLSGQSAIFGLGNLLPRVMGILLIPLYTAYLTPADYGILSITTTLISVLTIVFGMGQDAALTRLHYDHLDDKEEQKKFYGSIWIFVTTISLGLALLLSWKGELLFSILFKDTPFVPYGRLSIWISVTSLIAVIPLVLLRVREKPVQYVLFTVTNWLVTTILIIYFVAVLKRGAHGSLQAQLLADFVISVPFLFFTFRNIKLSLDLSKLKAFLSVGLPIIPHQLSGWALNLSDRIVLERFVSLDLVGIYSLGYRFAQILDMILISFNMAWAPFFFRTAKQEEDAPSTIARLTTYYAVFLVTLSLAVALLARDAIIIFANPRYHEAYRVIPVVVLAFVSHGLYFMSVNQLFYTKKTRKLPIFTMISAAINIGSNLLFVPIFGIMAAAWNTVVGYTVLLLLVFRESQKTYPIPYEYRRLVYVGIAGIITYFVGSLFTLINPWIDAILKLASVLIFPGLLLIFRFFSPREITGIQALIRRQFRLPND